MSGPKGAPMACKPAEDHPGWMDWVPRDPTRFNPAVVGRILVRKEQERFVRVRMNPELHHSNIFDSVHGGMLMALVDVSLFPTMFLLLDDRERAAAIRSMTVEASTQFIGPARIGKPLDAVGELLRQTGRMAFLRGVIEQDGALVASWSALVRKPAPDATGLS